MSYLSIYFQALPLILLVMTAVWVVSVIFKNASIVDPFWGFVFVVAATFYFFRSEGFESRRLIVFLLVAVWGLRLTLYLAWRNIGKGEDFRYRQFRKNWGESRYWWVSFFQVFMLQGLLLWLVSAALLGGMFNQDDGLNLFDYIGILLWVVGFIFEAGGDLQMARFKSKVENKGKLMDRGLWRYTRHPNYFGDAVIWWGFASFSVAAGSYVPVLGALLMTILLLRISGVTLLERTLKSSKPGYDEYIQKTPAFFPWKPKAS
jgi:steroid 5-alpha reductase family enzyme